MQVQGDDDGVWLSPHVSLQFDFILWDDTKVVGQAEQPDHVGISTDESWLAYYFNETLVLSEKGEPRLMATKTNVRRIDWVQDGRVCFCATDKRRWILDSQGKKEDLGLADAEYETRVFSVNEDLYVCKDSKGRYWVGDHELGFAPVWYDGREFVHH